MVQQPFDDFFIDCLFVGVYFYKHIVHKSVVGGSSMIRSSLVIADSKGDMQEIEPGPLG